MKMGVIMKNHFIRVFKMLIICCLFLLIFSGSVQIHASVREEIAGIKSIDSLRIYYNTIKQNLYKVRYFIRYTSDIFKDENITTVPDWFYDAIEYGLNSQNDVLIEEAIIATGKFKIPDFTGILFEIFNEAPTNYQINSTNIRCAVVRALNGIGGDYAEQKMFELLQNYPEAYIGNLEFELLLTFIPDSRSTALNTELDNFRKCAQELMEKNMGDTFYENERRKRYERLVCLINSLMASDTAEKGGE